MWLATNTDHIFRPNFLSLSTFDTAQQVEAEFNTFSHLTAHPAHCAEGSGTGFRKSNRFKTYFAQELGKRAGIENRGVRQIHIDDLLGKKTLTIGSLHKKNAAFFQSDIDVLSQTYQLLLSEMLQKIDGHNRVKGRFDFLEIFENVSKLRIQLLRVCDVDLLRRDVYPFEVNEAPVLEKVMKNPGPQLNSSTAPSRFTRRRKGD